jgi:hypothetical protein
LTISYIWCFFPKKNGSFNVGHFKKICKWSDLMCYNYSNQPFLLSSLLLCNCYSRWTVLTGRWCSHLHNLFIRSHLLISIPINCVVRCYMLFSISSREKLRYSIVTLC